MSLLLHRSPFGTLDPKDFMSQVTKNAVFQRSQSFDGILDDVTSSTDDVTQSTSPLKEDQVEFHLAS